jgi:hypothetical protein
MPENGAGEEKKVALQKERCKVEASPYNPSSAGLVYKYDN